MSDLRSIIASAQEGNPSAIQALYDTYADSVRRYYYVHLRDIEAAQACAQEVFLCIWKGIKKFEYRDELSFTAWLYTIANNVLVSYVGTWKCAGHVWITPELGISDSKTTDIDHIIRSLMLCEAIGRLTLEQQQLITLKFFVGLSNLEIAAILGCTEGAIKALQHRAVYHLQAILANKRPGVSSNLSEEVV